MSEPTYTITLTESERTAIAKAIGSLVTKLLNAPIFVEATNGGTQAARAVLAPASPQSTPAAAPSPTPVEPRDRWARDRKGKDVPPRAYETATVHLSKAERKDLTDGSPRMKVAWQVPSRAGLVDASCFDDRLFPWLAAGTKSGEKTTLYLVQAGKYLNVVGVRA